MLESAAGKNTDPIIMNPNRTKEEMQTMPKTMSETYVAEHNGDLRAGGLLIGGTFFIGI